MKFLTLICAFVVSGCANIHYGNFTDRNTVNDPIINDAIEKLVVLYPPAKTQFSFIHEITEEDNFATRLITIMRDKGYAVQEFVNDSKSTGTTFAYALDEEGGIYRLSLYIAGQNLSRPYIAKSGAVVPSGVWSLKE